MCRNCHAWVSSKGPRRGGLANCTDVVDNGHLGEETQHGMDGMGLALRDNGRYMGSLRDGAAGYQFARGVFASSFAYGRYFRRPLS